MPFRVLSFWLGLMVMLFLLWAWRDSMIHSAAFHRQHGASFSMMWPPLEPQESPSRPTLPAVEPGLGTPSLEIPEWGELGKDVPYFDSSIPEAQRMPLMPQRSPALLPDNIYRSSSLCRMQPYLSIGSKEGVIWFSSWISPSFHPKPAWTYVAEPSSGPWFSAWEWERNARLQITTLRIPWWSITLFYGLCWLLLVAWRSRRLRKGRGTFTAEPP